MLGHTDFQTIVTTAADRDLGRRILLTYAVMPLPYAYMAATDAQMGRRLPGSVNASPLQRLSVHAHTTVVSELSGKAEDRTREMAEVARRCANQGLGHVSVEEVARWERELADAGARGAFLLSETAYLVLATRD